MKAAQSRWLTLAGLIALAVLVLQPPDTGAGALVSAAPLGLLVAAHLMTLPGSPIATAIVMLPYFSYGVMAMLTDPAGRWRAVGFSVLTIGVFLAALDAHRRR